MYYRVIGGLLIEEGSKAVNKIIAVLNDDAKLKNVRDVNELSVKLVEQLKQYLITKKKTTVE